MNTLENIQPTGKNDLRLVILAASAGTLIEWYDLFLAIILANTLSLQLFPPGDSKFLETLAIVGSSFLVRPLGSFIFGSIGDRTGRKNSFLITLLLMGGATLLIGLLPTYNQVGWLAPVLLLVLRLLQGLAISGEYAGAAIFVAENAPPEKRGFYTGFIQATVPFGLLVSLSVVFIVRSMLPDEAFNVYGWRIPFLISIFLVIISYFIRRKLHESPVFMDLKRRGQISKAPIRESFFQKGNARLMLIAIFGGNAAQSAIMQTAQFVTLYFLQRVVKLPDTTSLLILAVAILLGGPFFQIFGGLSDRTGRKKIILTGLIISTLLIPVSFYLFLTLGNPLRLTETHAISAGTTVIFMILTLLMTLTSAMVYGPMGAFMLELFPASIRYTSMSFAQNMGNGFFGGATPIITEILKQTVTASFIMAPFIGLLYPLALMIIAIVINIAFVPETYKRDLNGSS